MAQILNHHAPPQAVRTGFGHVTHSLDVLSHGDDSTLDTYIEILDNQSLERRLAASEACFLHQNNHIHFI